MTTGSLCCILYSFKDIFFTTVYISLVVPYDIAVAVNDEYMGDIIDSHLAFELIGGVEQYLIVAPAFAFNKGLYFLRVLALIDADSHEAYAGFILPVRIYFVDSLQFTHARLAPCGEERDDDRFAIV